MTSPCEVIQPFGYGPCTRGKHAEGPCNPALIETSRRTSPEKLEKLRELMNEMFAAASQEPNDAEMQKLARYAERGHVILDGEW